MWTFTFEYLNFPGEGGGGGVGAGSNFPGDNFPSGHSPGDIFPVDNFGGFFPRGIFPKTCFLSNILSGFLLFIIDQMTYLIEKRYLK